ncbi:MAG TPA: hypothetical protein VHK05_09705 [Candidatus Limnocylindrales bacterium]|jgi:hypothetical protein|nr:hypothetical protein [Candidatus Limnocylindrales bacterium]
MTDHDGRHDDEQNGHVAQDAAPDPDRGDPTEQAAPPADLGLVKLRRLVEGPVDVTFPLGPGDRALVAAGESVVPGAPIIERVRDIRLVDALVPETAEPSPGGHIADGELLFEWRGRWRVAGGDVTEPIDSPIAGIVREVHAGTGILVRATGRALRGIVALGGPTRGELHVASWVEGELRGGSVDVGLAGKILVVGSRIDAETLTRARAMGVRGIIVAGLASKERRDYLASEGRQRAALHRLPPFAVLVLEGAVRRPLAGPVMDILDALEGQEVAIVADPPMLIFDLPELELPAPRPDHVRVRAGQLSGREGTWTGLVGPRRFAGGVHLEAGTVRFDDGSIVAVPLGDLERFA